MKKIKENKGFTIAELLIVVAIIAVLVAIAIPTFTSALNKARHETVTANVRSKYAEHVADYLDNNASTAAWASLKAASGSISGATITGSKNSDNTVGTVTISGPGDFTDIINIDPAVYSNTVS